MLCKILEKETSVVFTLERGEARTQNGRILLIFLWKDVFFFFFFFVVGICKPNITNHKDCEAPYIIYIYIICFYFF